MKLQILYRGHLSDCNYSCWYCPFSKKINSNQELEKDRAALGKFVKWVKSQSSEKRSVEILFTPFGEALVRSWYRDAITELSNLPHVTKVAVQTNLSCDLEWLKNCGKSVALWATFHPVMVSVDEFLQQCNGLKENRIRHSVGAVGIKEEFETLRLLRKKLDNQTYLWINAYKHEKAYYSQNDIELLTNIDPYFPKNLGEYRTKGELCLTGESVISIEGNGDVYRCNFVKEKRGNIFVDPIGNILKRSLCPKESCHCHIGYIHLQRSPLEGIFGDGILERIPTYWSLNDSAKC